MAVKCIHTIGHFFIKGYKFHKWTKKEVQGNYFHKSTLVSSLQSAIRVTIEFPPLVGETNFVESPKFTKSAKFVALKKGTL